MVSQPLHNSGHSVWVGRTQGLGWDSAILGWQVPSFGWQGLGACALIRVLPWSTDTRGKKHFLFFFFFFLLRLLSWNYVSHPWTASDPLSQPLRRSYAAGESETNQGWATKKEWSLISWFEPFILMNPEITQSSHEFPQFTVNSDSQFFLFFLFLKQKDSFANWVLRNTPSKSLSFAELSISHG